MSEALTPAARGTVPAAHPVSPVGTEAPAAGAPARPRRLDEIEAAKGLAITLVVVGHLIARGTPQGFEWYRVLKTAIYDFHMPLFMALSGFAFFYAGSHRAAKEAGFGAVVRSRALRLLAPFVVFGLLIVVGKYFAQYVIFVDQPPATLLGGVESLFYNTKDSPALSIWYIWVVFWYSLATPVLFLGRWPALLLAGALSIAAGFLPLTDAFYWDRIGRFYVFFLAGGLLALGYGEAGRWLDRLLPVALILFALSFGLEALGAPIELRLLVTGGLAIPAGIALCRLRALKASPVLLWLGKNVFIIYLLNTVFIGLFKALAMKAIGFKGVRIYAALPVMLAGGLLGPVATRRWLFRPVKPLYDLTR